MDYTQVTCPHCQQPFELTSAITSHLHEQVEKEISEKHKKELEAVQIQAEKRVANEVLQLKEENQKKEKQLEEARNLELQIRKEKNLLEEEKRTFELEKQRQLDAEREAIRQKTAQELSESFVLKEKEYMKKINDLSLSLEDAQRKATQGSQQLQGEVQELELKLMLTEAFPEDLVEDVEKGVRGADLRQVVRSSRGFVCGVILWECKRTKDWSDSWIPKLKEDLLASKANIPVVVSTALPKDFKEDMGLRDGVWVVKHHLALPLALALRDKLIEVAKQKYFSQNQGTKAELVYQYVTGHEFAQQVQAIAEVYQEITSQIASERVAFEKIWKRRESQAQRLITNTARIYGTLQGVAGASLPTVPGLELTEG